MFFSPIAINTAMGVERPQAAPGTEPARHGRAWGPRLLAGATVVLVAAFLADVVPPDEQGFLILFAIAYVACIAVVAGASVVLALRPALGGRRWLLASLPLIVIWTDLGSGLTHDPAPWASLAYRLLLIVPLTAAWLVHRFDHDRGEAIAPAIAFLVAVVGPAIAGLQNT